MRNKIDENILQCFRKDHCNINHCYKNNCKRKRIIVTFVIKIIANASVNLIRIPQTHPLTINTSVYCKCFCKPQMKTPPKSRNAFRCRIGYGKRGANTEVKGLFYKYEHTVTLYPPIPLLMSTSLRPLLRLGQLRGTAMSLE